MEGTWGAVRLEEVRDQNGRTPRWVGRCVVGYESKDVRRVFV